MTLLEVIVVMVLIVLVASLTFAPLRLLLADVRLTASADQVRARLSDARALAMEQGRPFRLAYLAHTGTLQVAAEDDGAWDQVDTTPRELPELICEALPPEVIFWRDAAELQEAGASPSPDSTWTTLAAFLPDGSAREDGQVTFGKPGLPPLSVHVRGLTGASRVLDRNREGLRP